MEWRASQAILHRKIRVWQMWELIREMISTRSFSSLWYWIVVALFWMLTTRQAMGLPQDMIQRAYSGGDALDDLQTLAALQAQRLVRLWRKWQMVLVGFGALMLSLLTVLGFWYGGELAQAVWFLAAPFAVIGALNLQAAMRILVDSGQGEALLKLMFYLRFKQQVLAMVFVFVTVVFALLQFLIARSFG
jgi:hypothetical protein